MVERRLLPRYSISVIQLNNDLVAVRLCGLFFSVENPKFIKEPAAKILHLRDASLKKFFSCDIIRAVRKTNAKVAGV